MEVEGKIWKSKNHWLIEIPSLNIMTQGKTREEALKMVADAVMEYFLYYFESSVDKDDEVTVNDYKKGIIGVTSTNNKLLLALSLRRQREKSGLTVTPPSAWAQLPQMPTHNTRKVAPRPPGKTLSGRRPPLKDNPGLLRKGMNFFSSRIVGSIAKTLSGRRPLPGEGLGHTGNE